VSKLLLFVESNTTGTGMIALARAAALGYQPVLLTSNPGRYQGLDTRLTTIVRCDTNSPEPLRRAVSRLSDRTIAGVTTTSEYYVAATAELAESLGLPGNPPQVVKAARNKAAVRRAMERAGLVQPRFVEVFSPAQVPDAVEHTGLPCVVKPVDDSGSHNVLVCASVEQAVEHARTVLAVSSNVRGQPVAGTALVEQYVEGPEFSVETFSVDGEAECIGVTRKTVSPGPHCVELGHLYPAGLDAATARSLAETTVALLRTLGVRSGPTHCELRLGPDGPVVIELNCRLAGGMIPELIQLAQGTDLIERQLRTAVGERPDPIPARAGWAGIRFLTADRPGTLGGVPGIDEVRALPGVVRAELTVRCGTEVAAARSAFDRLGFVIAAGGELDAVTDALERAAQLRPVLR
jgi:S-sulfo-L-cysteine synthase (3-phospho-L-serine-dependent)